MAKKKMTLEEKLEAAIVKEVPYELPNNWSWIKLNSLFDICSSKRILKDQWKEKGIPFYRTREIVSINKYGFVNNDLFIDEDLYEEIKEKYGVPNKNDIMVTAVGTLGKTYIVKEDKFYFKDANVLWFKNINNLNVKYIHYLYQSLFMHDQIYGLSSGSTVETYTIINAKKTMIPFPPLKEQQRIVDKIESLFEKLDKAKELIEEARDDFEKRKSAILEKAFRGELTKEWRKNNRVSTYGISYLNEISQIRSDIYRQLLDDSKKNKTKRPTKIHDVSFEDIQHENCDTWIKTKLRNILYDFRYGTSSKSDYSFDGIPVIRIPNLSNGYINHEDMKYLKENDVDMNNKVKRGDLVIVRSNGSASLVGKTSLITESEDYFAFASYLIRMRPCKVDSKYLYYVLNSISVKEQFYSKSKSTSGINNINTEELGNSIIPLPPLEEQQEIVKILDTLLEEESKINELTRLEEQIELIKKSILAKAFRGQLGTNCENDESALDLLKEILNKE